MQILSAISIAAVVSGLAAQSNAVPGLDGRLSVVSNATYFGRHGPAHPNGEIGMAMRNTMCNPGSVTIPWFRAMDSDHPKFGFLIVRVSGDKIEQINEWSFCKHAFASVNVSGACGTCQNPGTSTVMGLNCSDTYGAGTNASRTWLGPPQEIDPWLGTWEPVGSYFDIGDPAQAGFPAPADGVRDLSTGIFDDVDNRVTILEIDLLTPGASYYYGLQLIHEGEALANRGDNIAHRGFDPAWNGTTWTFPNSSEGQVYGSILDRWAGATVDVGDNGGDDGRFFVAVKTTPLGGSNHHYEYAVHNVDNSRAGGKLRIPVDMAATITNFTFGDIDTDGTNDWTAARIGNVIEFTAPASNPLEWNTIYNFGFDADFPPGVGNCQVEQARPGAGSLVVSVNTDVPGGLTLATFAKFGAGCAGSVSVPASPCPDLNPTGGVLSNQTNGFEYCYRVPHTGTTDLVSFEIFTNSNNGNLNRPAHVYANVGGSPSPTPLASTTIAISTTPGFYTATLAAPVSVTGTFYIGYENSPDGVISNLNSGASGVGFFRTAVTGNWSQSGIVDQPSYRTHCIGLPTFPAPVLGNNGLPSLGATYDVTLSGALDSASALFMVGFSDTTFAGVALPATLPGTPNCDLLVAPDVTFPATTSTTGTATAPLTVPNLTELLGLAAFHQWLVIDPAANPLGVVLSDAGRASVGN